MPEKERKYSIDVRDCYLDFEYFRNADKKFGYFSEDGASYTITDGKTPRPWMNMLYNDRFGAIMANRGEGFNALGRFYNRITRYFDPELYLPRELDGKRILEVRDEESGDVFNLFDAYGIKCKVMPGCSEFTGEDCGVQFCVKVFVPLTEPCECWIVELENKSGRERKLTVRAEQTWAFYNNNSHWGTNKTTCNDVKVERVASGFEATAVGTGEPYGTIYAAVALESCTNA